MRTPDYFTPPGGLSFEALEGHAHMNEEANIQKLTGPDGDIYVRGIDVINFLQSLGLNMERIQYYLREQGQDAMALEMISHQVALLVAIAQVLGEDVFVD